MFPIVSTECAAASELINKADQIISLVPEDLKERFSYELLLSEIESNTSISSSVGEAVAKIAKNRNLLGLVSEQSLYNLCDRNIELEMVPACR